MAAILSCLCWDSQAHGDSGEGDGCDLALHWRDFTLTFGRRLLHSCTDHRWKIFWNVIVEESRYCPELLLV